MSTSVSISGSGQVDITVFGNGTVLAGNGNDNINITGQGQIVVGSGNDTLTLGQGGTITEHGAGGNDTINIGSSGTYNIVEQGNATVTGAFGTATITGGGTLTIVEGPNGTTTSSGSTGSTTGSVHAMTHSPHMLGHTTMMGAARPTASLAAVKGGMGHDSLSGSMHSLSTLHHSAGPALLKNFVAGQDHLYLPAHSLTFTASTHAITSLGEKTMIGLDHGKTMIELHGVHVEKP